MTDSSAASPPPQDDMDDALKAIAESSPVVAKPETYSRAPRPKGIKAFFSRLLGPGEHSAEEMVIEGARFDHWLKKIFGRVILLIVVVQLMFANLIVFLHMGFGFGADVQASVIVAWISGTVVETIGLMAIVTQYLFPSNKSIN